MEPMTVDVRARFQQFAVGETAVSDWVTAEFSSALALKIRTGALTRERRTIALGTYEDLRIRTFAILPVASHHFHAAARYADRDDLNLRAADALHLAICVGHGATLLTLDRRLHAACVTLGVPTETL